MAFSFYFFYLTYVSGLIISLILLMKFTPFEDSDLKSYKNTIIGCMFLFIIIFSKDIIKNKIKNLKSSIVDVKLYTLMVSNL